MRIRAISPFKSATKQEIIELVCKAEKGLVVLQGYNSYNMPSPKELREVVPPGLFVFVEDEPDEFSDDFNVSK